MTNTIEWPSGWSVQKTGESAYWVDFNLATYRFLRSGGNEELWYVEQVWPHDTPRDITGQHATLQRAIDGLRRYLAGEFVPSGDVITVFLEGVETDKDLPIYHDCHGNQCVYMAIRDDRE